MVSNNLPEHGITDRVNFFWKLVLNVDKFFFLRKKNVDKLLPASSGRL